MDCFHRQEVEFSSRRGLRRAQQTQVEFVELEETLVGEKATPIDDGMNTHIPSKKAIAFQTQALERSNKKRSTG